MNDVDVLERLSDPVDVASRNEASERAFVLAERQSSLGSTEAPDDDPVRLYVDARGQPLRQMVFVEGSGLVASASDEPLAGMPVRYCLDCGCEIDPRRVLAVRSQGYGREAVRCVKCANAREQMLFPG